MTARHLRILFFDIETAPILAFVWKTFKENIGISQIERASFMLTWAARWSDRDEMLSDYLTKREVYDQDDRRIVENLAKLVRDADMICAHNVNGFDLKILNARLMYHGLEPVGPVRTIDTLTLAKANFRMESKRLDYLGEYLGLGRKIKTDFELWEQVYKGDREAMARMVEYNERDVELLIDVFHRMRPYVRNLPRLVEASYENDAHICPQCGSLDLQKRGFYRTQASTFQKWMCKDCGRYSRSRSSLKSKRLALHPL